MGPDACAAPVDCAVRRCRLPGTILRRDPVRTDVGRTAGQGLFGQAVAASVGRPACRTSRRGLQCDGTRSAAAPPDRTTTPHRREGHRLGGGGSASDAINRGQCVNVSVQVRFAAQRQRCPSHPAALSVQESRIVATQTDDALARHDHEETELWSVQMSCARSSGVGISCVPLAASPARSLHSPSAGGPRPPLPQRWHSKFPSFTVGRSKSGTSSTDSATKHTNRFRLQRVYTTRQTSGGASSSKNQ